MKKRERFVTTLHNEYIHKLKLQALERGTYANEMMELLIDSLPDKYENFRLLSPLERMARLKLYADMFAREDDYTPGELYAMILVQVKTLNEFEKELLMDYCHIAVEKWAQ